MSGWQVYFIVMSVVCGAHALSLVMHEGFPAGGVSFFGACCSLLLSRQKEPFA